MGSKCGTGQWGVEGMLYHLLTQIIEFILHVHYGPKRGGKKIKATFYFPSLSLGKNDIAGKVNGFQAGNFPVMFPLKMQSQGVGTHRDFFSS